MESFTHNKIYDVVVSKKYLSAQDNILLIDDFLANGNALLGLIDIVNQSGGTVSGIGIAVEKKFQGGGDMIREQGYRIESLARITDMSGEEITFG